jgi:methylenetetrahydrofolate reductase (NADH)
MTKVTEALEAAGDRPVVLCDFSPPRSGNPAAIDHVTGLATDFFCVAYNPGKAVRASSSSVAYRLMQTTGKGAVFNLGTRDMNKLAMQTFLLSAQILGLENVIVIQGDRFTERDLERVKPAGDYSPTELIAAIRQLNEGTDFRGTKLRDPTDFCVGASIDLGRGIQHEAALTYRKAQAGAQFLIAQPIFAASERDEFLASYEGVAGGALQAPVFWGLQVLVKDGVIFANVPQSIKDELEKGRDGAEIALDTLEKLLEAGIRSIYLVPPILRGGARDYEAAGRVLASLRARQA